jgi:DNA repair exonuclease SbcCD ATPase subunit
MTATAVPLESLAQRIAQQQSDLESLRQEYEARQARLADLNRRKGELETQLHQIDAQIQAVARGETPVTTGTVLPGRPAAPTRKATGAVSDRMAD